MATPHVAGVAAIYRSYNPTKTATEVRNFLVDQISTLGFITGLDFFLRIVCSTLELIT
jgi:subtilisin family serine protease